MGNLPASIIGAEATTPAVKAKPTTGPLTSLVKNCLLDNLSINLKLYYNQPVRKHLAIFKGQTGEKILSGEKTMESRFSRRKNPPFGVVASGDLVYIKPSGKDPIGQFRVQKVFFFDGLSENDLNDLQKRYGKEISAEENYWEAKKNSKYGTLIFIGEVDPFITSPLKLSKKDLRGWVVLGA